MIKMLILLIALQSAPVEGPISDMIGRRVDKLTERVEAWKAETEQAQQSRFAEMMQSIADARQERKTILESIQELREQRDGMFDGLAEFKRERDGLLGKLAEVRGVQGGIVGRLESLHSRFEGVEKRWTPIQNIVDRLIGLVWRIFWLVVSLFVVVIVTSSLGLFMYVRIRSKITKLAGGS